MMLTRVIGCLFIGFAFWSGLCSIHTDEPRDRIFGALSLASGLLMLV